MSVSIAALAPQGLSEDVNGVGLNQSGQACGSTIGQATGLSDAFSYQNGAATLIGPGTQVVGSQTIYPVSAASAINDSGLVVGSVDDAYTAQFTAAVWTNGVMTLLPGLGNSQNSGGEALAVNNSGQIVGDSAGHAVLWQNGVVTQLDTGGGGVAHGINDSGQIVGTTYVDAGLQATLWQNGTATYIAPVGSSAYGISKLGEVVGSSLFGTKTLHAFTYQNGTLTELPDLNSEATSQANAVNSSGWVVGESRQADAQILIGPSPERAVVWVGGQIINLNSLLPDNSPWVLNDAMAINDQGQIAGMGTYNGQVESFILTLNGAIVSDLSVQQVETQVQNGQVVNTAISDTAAHVGAALDLLQKLAVAGSVSAISLTDSGFAELTVDPTQISGDAKALALIGGNYYVAQTASAANLTLTALAGHGNIAVFSGPASDYAVASSGDRGFTVTDTGTGRSSTDKLTGFNALQFSNTTEIVAQSPGTHGAVTTGNIAELYAAVFGREPDVPGLAFYQSYLSAHPMTSLLQFAEWFLQSSEYTSNAAHSYALTTAGDAKFISDSYQNLLHRAPSAAELAYYQTNVIAPALTGPDLIIHQAYVNADLTAHAQTLVYFSASPEFLADVQITAQHPADAQHWLMLV